jgi:NADP-dependent 3-hydroxy acid dehydrogenase YdfG
MAGTEDAVGADDSTGWLPEVGDVALAPDYDCAGGDRQEGLALAGVITQIFLMTKMQALLYVTHAALPHLVKAAAGSPRRVADVVNISSTAGRVARPGSSVYNLTKFGVNAFSEALRQELVGRRVRVGVVEPGTVDTELVDHVTGDVQAAARKQVAAIEALRPEDIADAIAYIVTRDRRVAVNEMLVRAGDQAW